MKFGGALDNWKAAPYEGRREIEEQHCPECGAWMPWASNLEAYLCNGCEELYGLDYFEED
jgi:hypothetical protein